MTSLKSKADLLLDQMTQEFKDEFDFELHVANYRRTQGELIHKCLGQLESLGVKNPSGITEGTCVRSMYRHYNDMERQIYEELTGRVATYQIDSDSDDSYSDKDLIVFGKLIQEDLNARLKRKQDEAAKVQKEIAHIQEEMKQDR